MSNPYNSEKIPNHPKTLTVDTELGCGVWPKLGKVFWRERDSCKWNSYNQTWKRQLQVKQLQPNMKETAASETTTTKHERDGSKWSSYNQTWKRRQQVKQLQPNMKETAASETATTKHERDSCKWNSYNQTWKRQLQVKQLQPNMKETAESKTATTKHVSNNHHQRHPQMYRQTALK